MAGVSGILSWLGLKERPPWVDDGGLVHWERMDDAFRAVCAVWADGRCLVADGYGSDAHVREVLAALRATGAVPGRLRERIVPLERIAEARGRRRGAGLLELADPRTVERVYDAFEKAVEVEGDDIAIEVGLEDTRVKVCVHDRKLQIGKPLTVREGEQMIAHLMYGRDEGSGQTGTVRQSFQGFSLGAGEVKLPERITALRCERGPHAPGGQHLFARMFLGDRLKEGTTVQDLGFDDEVAEIFREIRMSKYGGVFLGGSTGDGKSTTIATNLDLLMEEHGRELNLVTVEDPVEIPIRDAIQIPVPTSGFGEERSKHFQQALMHFVRMHPAVGMVSEIRDEMGARQVLQFIDSGHQIWTTIHVHSANGILFRLLDLGVKPSEVVKKGNVRLLMKQTLIGGLCANCCLERPAGGKRLPAGLLAVLGPEVRFRNPEGCPHCLKEGRSDLWREAWAGYGNGRRAVAEWIVPDDGYLELVRENDAIKAWHYWMDDLGGETLGSKLWKLVGAGAVDPFDALKKGAQVAEAAQALGRPPAGPRLVSDS